MEDINVTTEILDLAEARRRLETIKPEIERLMQLSEEIRQLNSEVVSSGPESAETQALVPALEQAQDAWRESLKVINEQGGYVKDPTVGLLDFYSWHEGELVFLCWRHGEETIETWHGLHEGFAGRKPVSLLDS